ncbi:MAG: hypothetical protein CMJ74_05205 [Planctomycetaceae bacterium]|nr:hypothetical protein [Planctomycetaceae bacterium]
MPIFDFFCRDCQEKFEALLRSDEIPRCPRCAGEQLEKLLSLPATPRGSEHAREACQSLPQGRGFCGGGGCGMPECE